MRELKFTDPDELEAKIARYFDKMAATEKPPTLSGLALFLGTTRFLLNNYINAALKETNGKKAKCGEKLIMAKAQIECYLEEKLIESPSRSLEFILKNGYQGWGDTASVTVNGEVDVKHEGEISMAKLTDEELIHKLSVMQAKVGEIMKREGAPDGTNGG